MKTTKHYTTSIDLGIGNLYRSGIGYVKVPGRYNDRVKAIEAAHRFMAKKHLSGAKVVLWEA